MASTRTAGSDEPTGSVPRGSRNLLSRGLATVIVATAALFLLSYLAASSSLTRGTLLTMLPFASALAIAALGQTLVVMQGGIDLSVAGGFSLYVVIVTHYPAGDNSRLLPAIGIAFVAAIGAGLLNGFLIGWMRLNPIVATLGTNALLYGAVFWVSNGIPNTTTARLARIGGGLWLGIPAPVYFAVAATALVTTVVKLTPAGRRFEGVGANGIAALTAGIRVKRHRTGAYVWAQLLYCLEPSCTPASSTSRRRTRATTTSSPPSPPSCSAEPRCSAAAATSSRRRSPLSSCRSSTSSCSHSA